ncbi:hypothetical protein GCM10027276_03770 [Comamonas piscis]
MAKNPFDQFDEVNPFDQFDEKKPDVAKPSKGLLSTLAEVGGDFAKRMSGAGVSGVASIPEAVQSSARAGVRSGASGEPSSVMPGGVFIPGIDTDEAINGPMDDAAKAKRELGAERLALNVKVPFAGAIAKAGKDTQEDINKTTSQATQDAVANSQITGNLLKGEIAFGKDPSVRGIVMQGADVFGSMLPTVATAIITRSPGAAGAVGGAMAAGEGVGNARDFIAKQTHEQLLEHSPIYKRMVDAGASPEEARAITSARAEDTAALMQGAVASVGDRFTGKLVTGGFDKLLTRAAGKSVIGRAAAGAAVSGLEEGTQELSEGIASDLGIKSVAGNKEVGEDSAANFVLGALGGSAPGAGRGVVSGVKDRLADRAAGKQVDNAAPAPGAPPAAPAAPAAPADTGGNVAAPTPVSTAPVSPAPAQPQAEGQVAGNPDSQSQPAPAGVPEDVARARNPDGAPETMSAELAETRLAELELEASTTGLNPAQDAERQALAERVAVDRAQEMDAEAIGVPVDEAAAPGTEQGSARAAAENGTAAAPAAGVDSAAKESTARTWPQFVLEQGERVSELKKGTPRWNELKASWDALKISRAGQDAEGTGAAGEPKAEIQNRDRSRPASVIQMQGMAANPDYMRLGVSRSPESGAPMVFAVGDQAQAAVATGRGDTAVMSDGQRVPFQYAVMEAADVQPSNFADGAVNPLFDSAHPGTIKALNNGRTAGLRAAYERGTAEGYKRELIADSDMHGIDPAVIEGMKAPVLVRMYSEADNRTNMGAKSQSQALGLSASEQAATDATLMDNSVVDAFATGALDSAANRDFARAFIGKLQAAGQDVAGMMDANGALSPAGVTRLQAGLVHKAYGDGDLVESLFGSTDNDIRAIGEALKDVAGEWANLRSSVEAGAINPEVDVTANLLQAIRVVQKARRERGSLHDAINQVDMVTGDVLDPLTVGMLRLLYTGHYLTRATGRERLTESLREYMGSALATSAHGDMFGEQVGPTDILNALSGPPAQIQNEPTPVQQEQSPTAQGERVAPGRDPAGVRADEAGPGQSGSNPDRAGQEVAETGGRGQGQDAKNSRKQQNGQGDQGAGQDSSGSVTAAEPAAYGAANKLVSTDRAAELREKLKKKLGQLNSGIDPEMLALGAELAVFHIEAGARKFTDFVKAISADLDAPVSKIRPYLRSWYNGARDMMEDSNLPVDGMDSPQAVRDALAGLENSPVEAKDNATSTRTSVERDSQEPAAGSILAGGDERGSRADGSADRNEGGRVRGEVQQGKQGDPGVSARRPVIDGERSDQRVHPGDAIPELASIATGSDFRERGSDVGIGRIPVERIPTGTVAKSAAASPETAAATPSKRSAVGKPLARGIDSVRETLPMLLPGQQEDVVKAETRFDKPNGYGMLFTNGTGTGKTFTGLGVVARQVQQGKSNILILAPDAKVLNDWIESGDKLGVSLTALADTKDAGQGVVATTYANAGQNQALASRKWDMVVADEAHKLMQSEDARETDALRMVRALTLHPEGAWTRHYAVNAGKLDEVSKLRGELKDAEAAGAAPAAIAERQKKIDALDAELRDLYELQKAHIADNQGAGRPRALFLSATPFAYEKTVDWANGYLFDYPRSEGSVYNSGDGREQFMMQHFGYRMRYNKLTAPEAGVDSGLMQRNFNTWLRREGVLSSRVLDVDADYDRRFVLIDSDLGNRIDEVFRWIDDQARSEKNDSATFHSLRKLVQGSFDYLSRRYLLEAIKAEHSIPYVKKQLELGRKAVVFHDYKKGGGFNPFDVAASQLADYSSMPAERRALLDSAVREFRKEFSDLLQSGLEKMQSSIEAYKKAFGDQVLLVNGDEKAKALLERYKRFNNDQEAPAVLLVQSAKNAGWSGHDTTGKYQRVLVNLGQPSAPTMAIQQEGRIYRTGQVSDAIIRYFNTGTSWEKHTFAGTIAGRASAAENLSLGEEARALKDAFIQAFEESDYYEPGHEGEGKGGKARDRQINGALTEWDRAKAYYFGTQKKTARTKAQEGKDYFATPEPVGLKMVQWADMRPGEDALEPSAGHGAIARWFPDAVKRTVVEPSSTLRARLALNINPAEDRVVDGVFEDLAKTNKYDSIVMNPPFGVGGKTAMEHVAKAWAHLRDGGRLVALIPTGPAADKRLNEWLYGVNEKGLTNNPDAMLMADVALPQVAFERAGTAVAARILVLEKQTSQDKRAGYPAARQIDLTKVDSIQKLFDRLEAIEMRGRTQKALPVAEQAKAIHQARPAPQVNAPAEPKTVRGDEPIEEYVTAKGKPIRGIWRAGLTKEQAQAIDPYTFQKGGKWFLRERHLPSAPTAPQEDVRFSRSTGTQQSYEARIDELFAGGRPALDGVRVLDRSDIFGLLGINEKPVQLAEGKVKAGMKNHPRMTADLWKKVPAWLDNPAAVFESDSVPGRLVVVAPETLGNDQVLMVLDPDAVGSDPSLKLNLLINAYDKDGGPPPYMRWLASGLGRYVDKQKFPTVLKASGLQLPSTALQNKPGTRKILTEKNLSGYRKANPAGETALSRGESATGAQDTSRVQRVVNGFVKGWANAPEVIVTSDLQDDRVPKAVRDYDAAMRSDGAEGVPEGFYYKGKVYLVASQLHTPMDVVRVLFHETLGHHGLRHVFGAQLDPILQQLASQRAAQVKKKAAEYGLDMTDHAQRSMAAEEVLAEMAETHPELGYVKRAIAAVRQWLRKNVPALAKMQLTDADIIQSFILPARDFVVRGKAEASGQVKAGAAPAFSRAPAPAGAAQGGNGKLAQLQAKARSLLDPSKVDTWLYHWQDKFIDLKRIQEQIKALNGTVSETNDAYRGEELYHKRVAKRAANFLRDEVRPLMKAMNDAGVGIEEFERFLHARHAAEANKAMAERNPSQGELVAKRATADKTVTDLRNQLQRAQAQGLATVAIQKALGQALIEKADWDGAQAFNGTEDQRLSLSGMSDQDAAKILASYTGDAKKAIEDLAARVDKMNEGTLRTLDDYGLMDKATLNAWRNAYQHYVPLHRDEANPDSKAHPIGQGFSTKGDAAKKRTGSNEKVTNILSHIVMQREAALTRGEKNNVVKRLYLLAAQNPDASLWGLDLPKKKVLDQDTGLVRTVADPAARLKDNVITFRVGGKDKYLVFNERNERAARLALAVKNMDATELDWLSRTMGHATRWMAAVNTQYNPVFSVFNIVRDLQGASLQLSDTKLAGKQKDVLANIAKNTGKIWAELRRERREEGVGTGPWAQLMEQFQLDGGTTGFRELYSDPADRLKALQKELRKGTQGAAAKGASFALGVLSDFNESLEMTTRLATYKVALDNGLSRQEAASLAKNITVNFNRKGRVTSVLGSHYAFLNAAIQGNARLLQTMTGPAGRKIALGGVGLGVMMAMMGQLMMGGGDGADDEWKKIPEFVKERNIIIPLSRTQYVTIPMPLGFHVLPNLGRKMVDAAFHNDPTVSRAKYVGDMAAIALNAYNPFGGSDNMMQMFTPTWADPAIALATNKDWMGKSIFKEVRDINHPTPGHARVKDATALPYRWAARGINAVTGGSEWEQGAISPTPEAIQYLVEQAFGGVLREANKLGATATAAATGEELAPHQWFLAGRVYGNTTGMNGQSGTYYDNAKRINVALAEAKARVERGENVDAVLKDVPLAKAASVEKLADKRVSELTKLRRKVQASDLPDKKDQVKAINKEIEGTMRLLNQAVAEVVKQPS